MSPHEEAFFYSAKEVAAMGMTDEQFFSYRSQMLIILKAALEETPENKKLKAYIEQIEAELKRS